MTKTIYLNFDSINSTYRNGDPYDTNYNILPSLRNVTKIYLKSLEIPIGFHNIRSGSNLNSFIFVLNNITYTVTLTPKVYTSLTVLLSDLNAAIVGKNLPNSQTFVISVNPVDNSKLMITLGVAQPLSITQTNFSKYILGLANLTSTSSTLIYGVQNYLLNVDNYLNISLANLPTISNNNYNGVVSSFKIPLNCTSNVVYYEQENSAFTQYLEIADPNYIVNNLNIQILDRWGTILKSQGLDYSLTLAFVIENNN